MMKKKQKILAAALGGASCAVLTAYAVWDSIAHHGGRLVYPMDFYAFQPSDIPMILALALDALYIIALCTSLVLSVAAQRKQEEFANRTRRVSPKLGLLGFLGLTGFLGFYTYSIDGSYFPFYFFLFFGFFGFFFEGRMSHTLMDERYKENVLRSQRDAYRVGITILFLLVVLSSHGHMPADLFLPILLSAISLDLALVVFLHEYLLYRYDHDGALEPEEE